MDTSPSYNAIIWGLCLIGVYVISGKIRKGWLVNVPSFAVDSTTTTYELGFHGPTLIWQGRMDFSQQKQGIGSHKWWMDMGCQGTVQLPWQPQHKTWTIQYRNLTVEDCGESMKITMFIVVYPCLSILDLENIWKSPVFVAFHGTKTSTQPETSQAKAECADLSGADLRNAKLSGFSDVVEIEICGTGWSCGGLPVAAWFVIENP